MGVTSSSEPKIFEREYGVCKDSTREQGWEKTLSSLLLWDALDESLSILLPDSSPMTPVLTAALPGAVGCLLPVALQSLSYQKKFCS